MRLLRLSFLTVTVLCMFSSAHAQHSLQVDDGANHYSKIVAPTTPTTFKLPSNTGAAGQVLTSDGAGNTSFQPAGSFTPSFGYWFNTFPFPQNIPPNGTVNLATGGINTGAAFIFTFPGSITINQTGIYQIDFSITIGQFQPNPGQFSIAINGVTVNGTQYTCQPNSATQGMAYLSLNAGDVLTVVNSGFLNVTLGGFGFFNSVVSSLRLARVQ